MLIASKRQFSQNNDKSEKKKSEAANFAPFAGEKVARCLFFFLSSP